MERTVTVFCTIVTTVTVMSITITGIGIGSLHFVIG